MEIIRNGKAKLNRTLDGKGRVILPGDLRESAHFAPDEPVAVSLITIRDFDGLQLNKETQAFLITRQCDEDPEEDDGRECGWGHRDAKKRRAKNGIHSDGRAAEDPDRGA